ncbi:MAG TPA: hypothetical protein DEG17_19425 [Cyanobacteria bacterium UBA11149]|nr:hypothetical protein [Cyanobacteria bacterium UBA11367]HBE56287.1 hypothetical protein [Cyanobacteria bacterium UBA11366]HBR73615.1 hypothetical protein [Cyanobacteria bacterium UBA11159]HBS70204.1 hypothetical protein [Cyanobacteria bacterium UBA11153]HBW90974.1 hypothetical protein [Cyanobacteria bacterium UBA11149]HCA95000.1 hypothetical protein [Cyanobacteria bacterium UBA9226]
MRYQFYLRDKKDDLETLIALYQVTIYWAANRGTRFILSLIPGIYDKPEDEARLCSLGKVTIVPPRELTDTEKFIAQELMNACDKIVQELSGNKLELSTFSIPTKVVQVQGTPDEIFAKELTCKRPPQKALSGELCPVEDLEVFVGDRCLYRSSDYGTMQIFDLTEEEHESLLQTLKEADIDPTYLVRSLPYVTDYFQER